MFDSLTDQKFNKYFPQTWEYIVWQKHGSIYDNEGLFVFLNVQPEPDFKIKDNSLSNPIISDKENRWYRSYQKNQKFKNYTNNCHNGICT